MSNFFDMPGELKVTELSWPTKVVLGPGASPQKT
jgi:hypothetical protein